LWFTVVLALKLLIFSAECVLPYEGRCRRWRGVCRAMFDHTRFDVVDGEKTMQGWTGSLYRGSGGGYSAKGGREGRVGLID